jgi:hypothetical protein
VKPSVVEAELVQLSQHLHASREELREILWQVTSRIVNDASVTQPEAPTISLVAYTSAPRDPDNVTKPDKSRTTRRGAA